MRRYGVAKRDSGRRFSRRVGQTDRRNVQTPLRGGRRW